MKALAFVVLAACAHAAATPPAYFASPAPDAWDGGVRVLPLHTPKGDFHVWTKRVGNNPRIKVLLLTGGPGASH
ncbi:MAG TPA: hypothetical protein VH143_10380, partial [Kofleriaceae bacterium]|nr:hypothetical protein [Kofleriaceae bacterium]